MLENDRHNINDGSPILILLHLGSHHLYCTTSTSFTCWSRPDQEKRFLSFSSYHLISSKPCSHCLYSTASLIPPTNLSRKEKRFLSFNNFQLIFCEVRLEKRFLFRKSKMELGLFFQILDSLGYYYSSCFISID